MVPNSIRIEERRVAIENFFFFFNPLKKPSGVHFLSNLCKTAVDIGVVSNMTGDFHKQRGSESIQIGTRVICTYVCIMLRSKKDSLFIRIILDDKRILGFIHVQIKYKSSRY